MCLNIISIQVKHTITYDIRTYLCKFVNNSYFKLILLLALLSSFFFQLSTQFSTADKLIPKSMIFKRAQQISKFPPRE